jgi:NADPH:quinone reductase-like Zn-dependent oxidoreductase
MKAAVTTRKGEPDAIEVQEIVKPKASKGWVLIIGPRYLLVKGIRQM